MSDEESYIEHLEEEARHSDHAYKQLVLHNLKTIQKTCTEIQGTLKDHEDRITSTESDLGTYKRIVKVVGGGFVFLGYDKAKELAAHLFK